MINDQDYPRVIFHETFSERDAFEIKLKGWFTTIIESKEGHRFRITFYNPTRLKQELDGYVKQGEPCFAEPGLIVVPEVTVNAIQDSVRFLWARGFFDRLEPEKNNNS